MTVENKRRLSLLALTLTVFFWGAGFVFTDLCLETGADPGLINSIRFVTATIFIGVIFHKRIKLNKESLLYGSIGGVFLFLGFLFQLMGLKYTTAANNGFFTAAYVVFVPFLHWMIQKTKPSSTVMTGIAIALAGFFILNFGSPSTVEDVVGKDNLPLGNLLTILGSLFLAIHIVWSDRSLKKASGMTITWIQVATSAMLFVIYFFIAEFPSMTPASVNWSALALPVAFVAVLGTAFAYPSQIISQQYISPAKTSLIISAESVIGGIAAVIAMRDVLSWSLVVGGLLVVTALLFVEVLPSFKQKKILAKTSKSSIHQNKNEQRLEDICILADEHGKDNASERECTETIPRDKNDTVATTGSHTTFR